MSENNSITSQKNSNNSLPPASITGVSFVNTHKYPLNIVGGSVSVHCDYLTITSWGLDIEACYDLCIFPYTDTELVDQNHGARFYKDTFATLGGLRVYLHPINENDDADRSTIELPGTLCQIMGYDGLNKLMVYIMDHSQKWQVNRFDLAIDNCPFSPGDMYKSIEANEVRSFTNRKGKTDIHGKYKGGLRWFSNPFEVPAGGEKIGTTGLSFGSRESGRYLRVYDQHGFTRFELEYKGEYSKGAAVAFFFTDNIPSVAMGLVRDFIDILDVPITELSRNGSEGHLAEYWAVFVGAFVQLGLRIKKTARAVKLEEVKAWLIKQTSGAFSVIADYDIDLYDLSIMLLEAGRRSRQKSMTYKPFLREYNFA